MDGNPEVISWPVGLVQKNALALTNIASTPESSVSRISASAAVRPDLTFSKWAFVVTNPRPDLNLSMARDPLIAERSCIPALKLRRRLFAARSIAAQHAQYLRCTALKLASAGILGCHAASLDRGRF